MASLIFDSALYDAMTGAIDFDTDTFKCMLVTSSYSPNKGTHTKRSDVTNEVSGTGYTAGGAASTFAAANDTTNHRTNITLGGISLSTATITARGAVYYKSRGGAASADNLVAYIDFGADISSTAGTWSLTDSTLRLQN
jgi:hypothetical protein